MKFQHEAIDSALAAGDRILSFDAHSPDGHATEIGWGGERIEGPAPTYRITEGAVWGHKYTPPPAGTKGLPR
ncbi:hypothetical protein LCL87_23795 [Rhodococcus hoagii]|nr:hypothetical protein [Prescottella equi]